MTPKLLVVEDNDLDVERIHRLLRRLGLAITVERATDGCDALETLRNGEQRPDIALLDLNMPRLDGFEFLERLRSDPELATLPVVVLSTSNRPADIAQAHSYGVVDYLVKPISADDLKRVLRLAQYN